MSHLSKIFEEAPIKVQNRNGFDLSHVHAGTSKCGQLVPVLTKLIVPNSTISLGVQAEVNLPPLVAPFYGKVDFAIEGFIVPCSILYGGWKQFISNQEETQFPVSQATFTSGDTTMVTESDPLEVHGGDVFTPAANRRGYALPYFDLAQVDTSTLIPFRSLYNLNENIYGFMGLNVSSIISSGQEFPISMLPGLAYHKICDTFYRNTKLTRTWFAVNPNIGLGDTEAVNNFASQWNKKNVSLIWHSFYTDSAISNPSSAQGYGTSSAKFSTAGELTFPDLVSFFSTRQRQYARDYFTSAVPSPQQGGASVLKFSIDTTNADGAFTINALRSANALQKWLETANIGGAFDEISRNRWGVRPIDADFDEPHYLGRVVIPVYQHSVYKSDTYENSSTGNTSNPFTKAGLLGSQAGSAGANGEGSICDNFNVSTFSYLMVLASLVPHANYNQGINRELTMTTLGDFPAPELQTVGMEEIKNYEILGSATNVSVANLMGTYGYINRYSRLKYCDDHVSAELRPGATMQQYQLQRVFTGSTVSLGTEFVEIPKNALDDVLAVTTTAMNLTCWWEIYFNFKVVMPLADFCIPTLGDLQDTHTIKATVGGSRL